MFDARIIMCILLDVVRQLSLKSLLLIMNVPTPSVDHSTYFSIVALCEAGCVEKGVELDCMVERLKSEGYTHLDGALMPTPLPDAGYWEEFATFQHDNA